MAPAEPTSSQPDGRSDGQPAGTLAAPSAAAAALPAAKPGPPRRKLSLAARLRQAHAALAPFVLAPLLITVGTGMTYRLLRDWGGLEREQTHLLMVLHEGEWLRPWLGPVGETLYVLLNGLGLLWMLASGGAMAWQRLQRQWGERPGADT